MKIYIEPVHRAYRNYRYAITNATDSIMGLYWAAERFNLVDKATAHSTCYKLMSAVNDAIRKPPVIDSDTRYIHLNIKDQDEQD